MACAADFCNPMIKYYLSHVWVENYYQFVRMCENRTWKWIREQTFQLYFFLAVKRIKDYACNKGRNFSYRVRYLARRKRQWWCTHSNYYVEHWLPRKQMWMLKPYAPHSYHEIMAINSTTLWHCVGLVDTSNARNRMHVSNNYKNRFQMCMCVCCVSNVSVTAQPLSQPASPTVSTNNRNICLSYQCWTNNRFTVSIQQSRKYKLKRIRKKFTTSP